MKKRVNKGILVISTFFLIAFVTAVGAVSEMTGDYARLDSKIRYLPFNPYSALVYQSGSNYIAVDYKGQEITSSANKTAVIEAAISNTGYGTVYCRNVSVPYPDSTIQTSLGTYSKVTLLSDYEGIKSFYGDFGHLGDNNDIEKPALRFYSIDNITKPIIEWRDKDNKKVAWIVAHDRLNDAVQHRHISIETTDETLTSLCTRFQIQYGQETPWVEVVNAKFAVPQSGLFFRDPSGDYDTKMWSNAEDEVRILTNATTRLKVDNQYITAYRRILPDGDGQYSLGSADKSFNHGYFDGDLYAGNYYSGDGTQGLTTTINVKNHTDVNCTITVKDGLITGTTC